MTRIICATCGARTAPGVCDNCGENPSDLSLITCPECEGTGTVHVLESRRSHHDQGTVEATCIYCLGSGRLDRPYEDEHQESTWRATAAMPREERMRPTLWERSIDHLRETMGGVK
jgi:hypothetical protein